MVTLEIRSPSEKPLREALEARRLYRKGTNPEYYVDLRNRAEADLLAVNLNLLPRVRARVIEG